MLSQGNGGVDEGERVGHASADVMEVGTDEEVVIARLHGGVSNELELEGELVSGVDLEVVSQASQLDESKRGGEGERERRKKKRGVNRVRIVNVGVKFPSPNQRFPFLDSTIDQTNLKKYHLQGSQDGC